MNYLILGLLLASSVLTFMLYQTRDTLSRLRGRVTVLEVDTAVLMDRPHQGDKPNITSTPRLRQACELRVAHGTPILVMPNGEILPNQLDLRLEHPFEGGKKQLVKATVTLFVNLEDSMWLGSERAEEVYQRLKDVATATRPVSTDEV